MKLTEIETQEKLLQVTGWKVKEGKLNRTFIFSDFKQAFLFMAEVARIADRLNHHPEWSNIYNKVVINLITHDARGISELDFTMAKEINIL